MASLLKAIGNWCRAKKDLMVASLRDPVRDGKIAIEDSEAKLREFQTKVGEFMAANKRLSREIADGQREIRKWARVASQAASAGNEEDVIRAVQAKQRTEAVVQEKQGQFNQNEAILKKLREQIQTATAKIAQAKANHAQLVARYEGARVRKELAQASSELGGTGPLAELDNLQKAVDTEENVAEAFEELAGQAAGPADLAEKYGSAGASVDDEVAQLMARQRPALKGAPVAQERKQLPHRPPRSATSVSLQKGGNVSLTRADPGLGTVQVGLGWHTRAAGGQSLDIDPSVFLLTQGGKVRGDSDFIFYNSPASPDGSVRLLAANASAQGDTEMVEIDLSRVPDRVSTVRFCITIHEADARRQNFGMVADAFIRVIHKANGQELARYELAQGGGKETALIFGELYRRGNEWKFRAVGQGWAGGLAALARDCGVDID